MPSTINVGFMNTAFGHVMCSMQHLWQEALCHAGCHIVGMHNFQ
jgi:hypothetical protein